MTLSSKVVSFTSTSTKKYCESLGTVRRRKCHGKNQFFSFFYLMCCASTSPGVQNKMCLHKNLSLNGWYLPDKREEKQKTWNFYCWIWFLHPARKCSGLAAKTALDERTCSKWLSACWQTTVPNIPKADCSQGTPYLEDEHGKVKKLYSLNTFFAVSYFLSSVSDTEINCPVK